MGKEKGNAYERELCVIFSKWWSGGKSEDLFYRTHGSGGRATSRARFGKQTPGSDGDLMCVDPDGQVFIDRFSIEAKNGYGMEWSVQDILEKTPRSAKRLFEEFWEQAVRSATHANKEPLLVFKKNRRQDILCVRTSVAGHLGLLPTETFPSLILRHEGERIMLLPLKAFLENVSREQVEAATWLT